MTWVNRGINNPTSSWKLILDDIVGLPFEYLLRCTGISKNILEKLPKFYRNIMHDLNTVPNNKSKLISEIAHETILFNRNISIDHNTVFWICWFRSGIRYVEDMLNCFGNILSQDKLNNKYKINRSFINHLRIRQAIPGSWRHIFERQKINYLEYKHASRPLSLYIIMIR